MQAINDPMSGVQVMYKRGDANRKTAKDFQHKVSLLMNRKNKSLQEPPLPYIVKPLLYSMPESGNFELMSKSIARDVFNQGRSQDQEKEVLQHTKENFIFDIILPVPMAGCMTLFALEEFDTYEMYDASRHFLKHLTVLTGSSSDGLALPEVTHMNTETKVTEIADLDMLFIFSSFIIDGENKRAFCHQDTSNSPPGFTKLIFNKDWLDKRPSKYPRERVEEAYIRNNYPSFVDSASSNMVVRNKFVRILRKYLRNEIHSSETEKMSMGRLARNIDMISNINFSYHGPAVTSDIGVSGFLNVSASNDYVVALPFPRWPQEAAEWVHRERVWPPKQIVRFVVKGGCHIVPKGDKYHKDPNDFLISFSYCEKLIALSLSIKQKRCYMLFKFLFKYSINKVNRGLTTYHCKTLFFWFCEEVHEDQWSETHPFDFVMRLLNQMEKFLEKGVMPQYFIPQRNMIHHMNKRTRSAVMKDIQKLRENPVRVFLTLAEKHRFCWFSRDISVVGIFGHLLSNNDLFVSFSQKVLLEYVSVMLDKGEVGFVLSLLCGIEICDEPPSTETSIHFLEKVVDTEPGSNCQNVQALLATLYHQHALENTSARRKLMNKSISIFEKVVEEGPCHAWIISEYYNLLYNLESYDKIIYHFSKVIRKGFVWTANDFFKGGIYTNVDFHNRATVEESIQVAPEFIVPAILYVCYKAITACMCFIRQQNISKEETEMIWRFVNKLIKKLQLWIKNKEKIYPEYIDEYSHIIVGLAYRHVDDITHYNQQIKLAENLYIPFRQKGNSVIYSEPVTVRIHHRFGTSRYQPYKRKSKRKRVNVTIPDLDLRFRDFRVSEYVHY